MANKRKKSKLIPILGAGLAATIFSLIGFRLFEFSIFGGLFSIDDVNLNINMGGSGTKPETTLSMPKPDNPLILQEHVITGEGRQTCQNQKPDYACKRIAMMLAERDLAEKVNVALIAQSTLDNGTLTTEFIRTQTQAIIANRTVVYHNYDADDNSYVYRLQATVGSF
jgi:hypothetical protein